MEDYMDMIGGDGDGVAYYSSGSEEEEFYPKAEGTKEWGNPDNLDMTQYIDQKQVEDDMEMVKPIMEPAEVQYYTATTMSHSIILETHRLLDDVISVGNLLCKTSKMSRPTAEYQPIADLYNELWSRSIGQL